MVSNFDAGHAHARDRGILGARPCCLGNLMSSRS